jgi:hypothetical protein
MRYLVSGDRLGQNPRELAVESFRRLLGGYALCRLGVSRHLTLAYQGSALRFHPTRAAFDVWLQGHGYRAEEAALIRRLLAPGDRAVDVGASIGALAIIAAKAVGRAGEVFAIEPDPTLFGYLLQNAELNGPALSLPMTNLIACDTNDARGSVPRKRLDDLLGRRPIGLLRLDTGCDVASVLRGAARVLEQTRTVMVTATRDAASWLETLEASGHACYRAAGCGFGERVTRRSLPEGDWTLLTRRGP